VDEIKRATRSRYAGRALLLGDGSPVSQNRILYFSIGQIAEKNMVFAGITAQVGLQLEHS